MSIEVHDMPARSAHTMERFNVAEAKRRLSDLLGRVAYAGETIVITRRGRPMAKLVPALEGEPAGLAKLRGWLDEDDPFFAEIDGLVAARSHHLPRVLARRRKREPNSG
jgi:prevent-host-death family protein